LAEEKRNGESKNKMRSRQQQDERTQDINSMVKRNVKAPKTETSGPDEAQDILEQHIIERDIIPVCPHYETRLSLSSRPLPVNMSRNKN
jgi:hypothetical protein